MTEPTCFERREVYFSGGVQGVGFRYTTERLAARFDVRGFVQNLGDGRVLLVVEGRPEEIDRFVAAVHRAMDRGHAMESGSYVEETRPAPVSRRARHRQGELEEALAWAQGRSSHSTSPFGSPGARLQA